MELCASGQFGFMDDLDRQFGNHSVWTRTRTRRDDLEPLPTLAPGEYAGLLSYRVGERCNVPLAHL